MDWIMFLNAATAVIAAVFLWKLYKEAKRIRRKIKKDSMFFYSVVMFGGNTFSLVAQWVKKIIEGLA